VFAGCILLSWGEQPVTEWIAAWGFPYTLSGSHLLYYCSPTILAASTALLVLFSRFRFGAMSKKVISFFSPLAFSVYLIHVQPQIWTHFIKDRFAAFADMSALLMMLSAVGTAFGIWLICSLIDAVRLRLFRLLKVRERCGRLDGWLQRKLQ